jgi:hypothetical protein
MTGNSVRTVGMTATMHRPVALDRPAPGPVTDNGMPSARTGHPRRGSSQAQPDSHTK